MKNNYAVKLSRISKDYIIHHEKPTLVEKVLKKRNVKFRALHNINLVIKKGERVGIVGPNGSGKTTLLKIIAGIAAPTKGEVVTQGRVVSLIDLEAGFHPDLTGEQNIYLNGMLLGMSKKEMSNKISDIIKFADIGQFIYAPLFTYSEGMKLRLGFSIVTVCKPDILILDESFSVGDADFQKKTINKIREFEKNGATIIVVSHWLEFIKKNCKRIIVLEKGKILHDGGIKSIPKVVNY